MNEPRRDWLWWGWGEPGRDRTLSAAIKGMLESELGPTSPTPSIGIDEINLPEPARLPAPVVDAVGADTVFTGHEDRVRHAVGKSYHDMVRLRSGQLENVPDAVLLPADPEVVAATLQACAESGIAVVPYGGGTSVVGGVEALSGSFNAVVSLDLSRLRAVAVDPTSLTARLGPGLRGPEAESLLGARGLTIGHFPQSWRYATIGGFAATRSAGQASSGYGRFDELVTSIEMQTPSGPIRTLRTPHTAAGPALRELVVGSEGTLGVITDVTVRLRRAPTVRRYEAWMASGFEEGADCLRGLVQSGSAPDVLRLSDREETRVAMAQASAGVTRRLADLYLAARRRRDGCLIICGWEGERAEVAARRERTVRRLRSTGAAGLGSAPGQSWLRGRFDGPYLRDSLIENGVMAETLETSHTWSSLQRLYRDVRRAISASLTSGGGRALVMCHISHVYRDGASLYFTFIAPQRIGAEIEQWRQVKAAACEAIVAAGGTVTHHHAVGTDHAPYMPAEVGRLGVEALGALKASFDPTGVMNPGKLIC